MLKNEKNIRLKVQDLLVENLFENSWKFIEKYCFIIYF